MPCFRAVREPLHLAAGRDMGEPDFVGESSDEEVALGGEFGGDAAVSRREAGENQETTFVQRCSPSGREAQFLQTAGGADDDWRLAAQENVQAFFFDGGMEAADDALAGVAPAGALVVGAEDGGSRAARGAEKPCFGQRPAGRDCRRGSVGRARCRPAARASEPDNGHRRR